MQRVQNSKIVGSFCASLVINAGFILYSAIMGKVNPIGAILMILYNSFTLYLAVWQLNQMLQEEEKNRAFIESIKKKRQGQV